MKRIVIVYNKHSSKYKRVEAEVLSRLPSGYSEYIVNNKKEVDANAEALSKLIQDGDRIVAAGGDGTATICVNAILATSAQDVSFGIVPYGNFNDMARTFGFMDILDIISPRASTVSARPLELSVNGKHFRYGMCYFTLGMFAESTKIFDQDEVRSKLRSRRFTRVHAIKHLAHWYTKHRHDLFLPAEFKLNGKSVKNATDYVAVNSATMASLMRNRRRSYSGKTFVSKTGNLGRWLGLVGTMAPSILWQIPGNNSERDTLEFAAPADLEVQAEGEYCTLKQVSTLEISKPDRTINVVTDRL